MDGTGGSAERHCCFSYLKECIRFVINLYTGGLKQTDNKVE